MEKIEIVLNEIDREIYLILIQLSKHHNNDIFDINLNDITKNLKSLKQSHPQLKKIVWESIDRLLSTKIIVKTNKIVNGSFHLLQGYINENCDGNLYVCPFTNQFII